MKALSLKQRAMLGHVADGWTNRQIAKEYDSTISAVATELQRIFTFLHATNRAHAVAIALRNKVIR